MAGGIFAGNINSQATALMMIGMLAFACAWEGFTNWLSSKVRAGRSPPRPSASNPLLALPLCDRAYLRPPLQCEDNKAHKEMLSKAYKELIILGFIAFSVSARTAPAETPPPPPHTHAPRLPDRSVGA
jgi:hypothetical protein